MYTFFWDTLGLNDFSDILWNVRKVIEASLEVDLFRLCKTETAYCKYYH